MRPIVSVVIALTLTLACGPAAPHSVAHSSPLATPTASMPVGHASASPSYAPEPSPNASASPTASASPIAIGAPCNGIASSYGLLISWSEGPTNPVGQVTMIGPDGCVGASARISSTSQHSCQQGMGAVLAPPVSATNDKVFFRDGDTRIRYLTPSGQTGDVTAVPGGPSVVSLFSVSPDDQKIAVLVEDLSGSTTIDLQLYVEDLVGGGHHSVIYTTTVPMAKGGTTLWPRGWHNGNLVLAVVNACTFEQAYMSAWHVVDSTTGVRELTVGSTSCGPGWWPSPAGLTCFDYTKQQIDVYDWSGHLTSSVGGYFGSPALSPSGNVVSLADGGGLGNPSPVTTALPSTGGIPQIIRGAMACLWIDDSSMLAPGAVISYPAGEIVQEAGDFQCAGRFPGGL